MIKIYKAFRLPHLEYCSPLFVGILGTGQRNRLEDVHRAQNNVIRRVANYG